MDYKRVWEVDRSLWDASDEHYLERVNEEIIRVLPRPPYIFEGAGSERSSGGDTGLGFGGPLSPSYRIDEVGTVTQVHEMQSRSDKFAFAIAQPAGYQGYAFQASSPKTSRVAFGGPFFV